MNQFLKIAGKSGRVYSFVPYLISEKSLKESSPGFTLYARLFKFSESGKYEWVVSSKHDINPYILKLSDVEEVDIEFVINDLKEDDTFKIKVLD